MKSSWKKSLYNSNPQIEWIDLKIEIGTSALLLVLLWFKRDPLPLGTSPDIPRDLRGNFLWVSYTQSWFHCGCTWLLTMSPDQSPVFIDEVQLRVAAYRLGKKLYFSKIPMNQLVEYPLKIYIHNSKMDTRLMVFTLSGALTWIPRRHCHHLRQQTSDKWNQPSGDRSRLHLCW